MNHLCNSHCEFCGCDLVEEYTADPRHGAFFSLLLVSTRHKFPVVLDYDFQTDFSCSVCMLCAGSLLTSDEKSYAWDKCHCCGLNTRKDDLSAFRMTEVVPLDVEEHLYKSFPYEFLSANLAPGKGPTGYTVCMSCCLPELQTHHTRSGEEVMRTMICEAILEGDVEGEHEEMLPS